MQINGFVTQAESGNDLILSGNSHHFDHKNRRQSYPRRSIRSHSDKGSTFYTNILSYQIESFYSHLMEFTVKMMCPSLHLREKITHVAAHQELVFLYHRANSAANTLQFFITANLNFVESVLSSLLVIPALEACTDPAETATILSQNIRVKVYTRD